MTTAECLRALVPRNQFGAASFPPVICRRLKAGDPQPFEWWDEDTGRWARGDMLPPALVKLLPVRERERVEAHRWRWIGVQAEAVHPCPRG